MGRIKGFSKYRITKEGEVISYWKRCGRVKKLKPYLSHNGYRAVRLVNDAGEVKNKRVGRLVAEAYLKDYCDGLQVNHKNGIRDDDRLENLEVCTCSENHRHAFDVLNRSALRGEANGAAKLTELQVRRIKLMQQVDSKISHQKISGMFGVSRRLIGKILNNERWRHVKI